MAWNNYEHFMLTCTGAGGQDDDCPCPVEMELERWREFIQHIKDHQRMHAVEDVEEKEAFSESEGSEVKQEEEAEEEDCLAEAMFVDLPVSSAEESSSEAKDEVDSSSVPLDSEQGATDFSPLSKVSHFPLRRPRKLSIQDL